MADFKIKKTGVLLPHTHTVFLLRPFSFLNCARISQYVLGLILLALLSQTISRRTETMFFCYLITDSSLPAGCRTLRLMCGPSTKYVSLFVRVRNC